jgi:hypothetical protein
VGAERTRTVAQALYDLGDRDHRGIAGEDCVRPHDPLDLDEQPLLQRQIFEHGLDDIVRLAHRGGKIAGRLHTLDCGNVIIQIPKVGENARLDAVKVGRNRIVDRDVVAGECEHLGDAVAHEPGADDGDARLCHRQPAV